MLSSDTLFQMNQLSLLVFFTVQRSQHINCYDVPNLKVVQDSSLFEPLLGFYFIFRFHLPS